MADTSQTREIKLEIEKNASGWFWRLRIAGYCIATSPRDYETLEAMIRDLIKVKGVIKYAKHVWLTPQ